MKAIEQGLPWQLGNECAAPHIAAAAAVVPSSAPAGGGGESRRCGGGGEVQSLGTSKDYSCVSRSAGDDGGVLTAATKVILM